MNVTSLTLAVFPLLVFLSVHARSRLVPPWVPDLGSTRWIPTLSIPMFVATPIRTTCGLVLNVLRSRLVLPIVLTAGRIAAVSPADCEHNRAAARPVLTLPTTDFVSWD